MEREHLLVLDELVDVYAAVLLGDVEGDHLDHVLAKHGPNLFELINLVFFLGNHLFLSSITIP